MIYNEEGEEDADWWENGQKKKPKESIFNVFISSFCKPSLQNINIRCNNFHNNGGVNNLIRKIRIF